VRNSQSFNIGGGNWDIDFVLRGPDLRTLAESAEKLRDMAPKLGVIDSDTTLKLNKPELRIVIDRPRAADLGVDTQDIATAMRLMVGGDQRVSRFLDPASNEDYDVALRLDERDRMGTDRISRLFVPGRDGAPVRLDNVVTLERAETASRIDRLDRQRQVSLRGSVAPGYGLADRLEALKEASAGLGLPAGYSTAISGRGRELERTFTEFIAAFVLSIVFMYMILAAQYESLIHPLTILLALPLSVPFALLSLWATGNTLNLYSASASRSLRSSRRTRSSRSTTRTTPGRGHGPDDGDHAGEPRPAPSHPLDHARARRGDDPARAGNGTRRRGLRGRRRRHRRSDPVPSPDAPRDSGHLCRLRGPRRARALASGLPRARIDLRPARPAWLARTRTAGPVPLLGEPNRGSDGVTAQGVFPGILIRRDVVVRRSSAAVGRAWSVRVQ
jgi:hypothetical protein